MSELFEFGRIVLLVAAGFSLALASSKLTERFPLPGPAIFLLAAALASDLFPALADHTSNLSQQRAGQLMLASARPTRWDAPTVSIASARQPRRYNPRRRLTADAHS